MDNVFPEFNNYHTLSIPEFTAITRTFQREGDILEFGVCTANTITAIAQFLPDRKVYGFDHFLGLEKTQFPHDGNWNEGAFRLNDPQNPHIPKTIEEVRARIAPYTNIQLVVEDIHTLKAPAHYGISKIVAAHIDVDIYEPTVSSLKFIDQCQWTELFIRFDDWHGHEPVYDHHERRACREWLERNKYQFNVSHNGEIGGVFVRR